MSVALQTLNTIYQTYKDSLPDVSEHSTEQLEKDLEFWKKMDNEKQAMLQKWAPIINELSKYGDLKFGE